MGFPKYMGVPEQKGAGVSFESKLQQIHFLYPKLGEMYEHYMNLITEFTVKEMERVIDYPDIPIDYSVLIPPFSLIMDNLVQSERMGYEELEDGYFYRYYEYAMLASKLIQAATAPFLYYDENGFPIVMYNPHLFEDLGGYNLVMGLMGEGLQIGATYIDDFDYLIREHWQYDEMKEWAARIFELNSGESNGDLYISPYYMNTHAPYND